MTTLASEPASRLPAHIVADNAAPWIPLGDGKSFKLLRVLGGNRGFVELLRLEPGVAIPWHRHTGDVHAYNLQGTRELHTGEIIGPGDYVYEPVGNTDTWKAIGDVPLIVLVIVTGAVEYIGAGGKVTARYTGDTLLALYHAHCEKNGIEPMDLAN
ncbi:MAG TPA: cupin domain-containing protein [Gammaproteobacteria bacterium]